MDFKGKIDDTGKLIIYARNEFDKWVIENKGCSINLSVKSIKKKRSNLQNAYLWGVAIPLIQEAMNSFGNDFTKETVHEFLKKEFNSKEVEVNDGYYINVPDSTTNMSTTDFMDYIIKIQKFATEVLGIYIPDPNQQLTAFH